MCQSLCQAAHRLYCTRDSKLTIWGPWLQSPLRLQKQPFLSLRLWPEHRCFQCCHHGLCSHVTSTDIVQQHILAYCIMGQSLFPKQCMSMQRQGALANPQQGSVQHSNSWHQKCHSLPSSLSTPAGVVSSLMILLKR